jgi:hypothetical protein
MKREYLIGIVAVVAIALVILVARYYKNEEFTTSSTNDTQIVENYPTNPQNVLTSDASGNLVATSDLGLQSLSVNGDIGIGPSGKFKLNPGANDNWLRLFNNANQHGDQGFAATRLWTQNIHGKPVFVEGVAGAFENDQVVLSGQELGGPGAKTRISAKGIIFGGDNKDRQGDSAQISAGRHDPDALCIVGMSKADGSSRRIHMWSEGGTTHDGSMNITGRLIVGGVDILSALDACVKKDQRFSLQQTNTWSGGNNTWYKVAMTDSCFLKAIDAGCGGTNWGDNNNFQIKQ